jgi:hypothetical protein
VANPFLLSVLLVGVSIYAQSQMDETPAGAAAGRRENRRSPFIECLVTHPRQILLAAGATVVNGAVYYLVATFILSYATQAAGVPRSTILTGVLISAVVSVVAIPVRPDHRRRSVRGVRLVDTDLDLHDRGVPRVAGVGRTDPPPR